MGDGCARPRARLGTRGKRADKQAVALSRDKEAVALSRDKEAVALSGDKEAVALSRDKEAVALSRDKEAVALSGDKEALFLGLLLSRAAAVEGGCRPAVGCLRRGRRLHDLRETGGCCPATEDRGYQGSAPAESGYPS